MSHLKLTLNFYFGLSGFTCSVSLHVATELDVLLTNDLFSVRNATETRYAEAELGDLARCTIALRQIIKHTIFNANSKFFKTGTFVFWY